MALTYVILTLSFLEKYLYEIIDKNTTKIYKENLVNRFIIWN